MRRKIVALCVLPLALVAALAAGVTAQSSFIPRPYVTKVTPRVMSGEDLGFRVEGIDSSGKPIGRIVIRVNGEWVEAGVNWSAKPAMTEH